MSVAPVPPAIPPQSRFGPQPTYHYDLQLDIRHHDLAGHGTIDVVNNQATPLDDLVLRSWGSSRSSANDGGRVAVTGITVDGARSSAKQHGTVIRIPLARPLQPGERTQIGLDLEAHTPRISDRFGSDKHGNVMFGNVLPTLAVRDDEGWNTDPYMPWGESSYTTTADWDVTVRAPVGATVIASGTVVDDASAGADVVQHIVAPNVRDFYVGAGTELDRISTTVDGTRINVYTGHKDAKEAQTMLSAAAASFRYFTEHVGTYDYPELDVVGVPHFVDGGMEYPNAVLVDTKYDTAELYSTVAHEVAHQWFYGMAGNNQYDDPWLDESLTTFVENRFLHDTQGRRLPRPAKTVEAAYKKAGDHHLSSPVSVLAEGAKDDASAQPYISTVYKIGPMVLEELRSEIGAETFDRGLRSYFDANKHGIGTTQELITAMSQSAGTDLTKWFAERRVLANEPHANDALDPNGPAAPGASYGS